MNVNNSDFGFIDSDGSSHSEVVDTLKGFSSQSRTSEQQAEDSPIPAYREEAMTTPEEMFTLKDTYIPEMNSSFEITASSNKLLSISPVCQENCKDCLNCDQKNVALHGKSRVISKDAAALPQQKQAFKPPDIKAEPKDDFKTSQNAVDDNGNLQRKVVSARFRPKAVTRTSSCSSLIDQNKNGEGEFEQFLSLVKNLSQESEGPLSYQPNKLALSSSLVFDQQTNSLVDSTKKDQTQRQEINSTSHVSSLLKENCVAGKHTELSFEDFHAKVAPTSRTPSKSKIGQSLQEPSSAISSALSPSADAQAKPPSTPVCCPSIHPPSSTGVSTTLAVAPYTSSSSSSSSYSATSTTDQPLVDARHSLLPEETQPASNLPRQESRPHPVKPLTSSQSEKKESRSVLEKLKSTIHPGRSAHQVAAEPEKTQEVTVDNSAQYQHLTNMELIALLLQQEMDMQKQQAASERQGAQLEKCEAELRKVKLQVRDLEDYIDNLLLRIMEQTPTLLQVRSRHK